MFKWLWKLIKEWIDQYPSIWVFLEHKLIHFFGCALVAWICMYFNQPVMAWVLPIALGISKEISDMVYGGENWYSAVFDVCVDTLGTAFGIFVYTFLLSYVGW